jgi:predicted kinase
VALPQKPHPNHRSPLERPVVLIIAGPPGAGKTATANLVAQRFDRAVCLEADWFWTTIVKGFVPPWRPDADAQNRAVLTALAEAAAALARGGYHVVIDGVVGPWYLGLVTDPLARHDIATYYVVLRPALEVTRGRVAARLAQDQRQSLLAVAFLDEDPVARMWVEFSDLGEFERHVIDNTNLDVPATAAVVWNRYCAGTHRL